MVRSCCYLDVYPRHGDIGVDGMDSLLECLVLLAHGFLLWRPCGRCLRSMRYLSVSGVPIMRRPGLPFLVIGLGGLVMESRPLMLYRSVVE
jgi:hypothetical protein